VLATDLQSELSVDGWLRRANSTEAPLSRPRILERLAAVLAVEGIEKGKQYEH